MLLFPIGLYIPASGGGGASTDTFNPSDKTSLVALSNGNLTALVSGFTSGNEDVRTSISHSTGKYYFEAKHDTVGGGTQAIGIRSAGDTLGSSGFLGQNNNGFGFWSDRTSFMGNANKGAWCASLTLDDWIGVAVDLDNLKIWAKNITSGDPWNNTVGDDPATNTGGFSLSALANGPWKIHANFQDDKGYTLNTGATSYQGTAPSGFSNW